MFVYLSLLGVVYSTSNQHFLNMFVLLSAVFGHAFLNMLQEEELLGCLNEYENKQALPIYLRSDRFILHVRAENMPSICLCYYP